MAAPTVVHWVELTAATRVVQKADKTALSRECQLVGLKVDYLVDHLVDWKAVRSAAQTAVLSVVLTVALTAQRSADELVAQTAHLTVAEKAHQRVDL
mmetsp:Transcript_32526/g.60756  ORF Transcript_32526/g.60756 Transcript_32526/m.60756 type:complete len:97 (+) Transcript_32526:786-1076(+)